MFVVVGAVGAAFVVVYNNLNWWWEPIGQLLAGFAVCFGVVFDLAKQIVKAILNGIVQSAKCQN